MCARGLCRFLRGGCRLLLLCALLVIEGAKCEYVEPDEFINDLDKPAALNSRRATLESFEIQALVTEMENKKGHVFRVYPSLPTTTGEGDDGMSSLFSFDVVRCLRGRMYHVCTLSRDKLTTELVKNAKLKTTCYYGKQVNLFVMEAVNAFVVMAICRAAPASGQRQASRLRPLA
ncbi:hypothetical protein EVAR_64923_1 [Eumeta japonica]|uniref:Uncharacterized protein n=1 Tax=Eumeta variegata TaxID=151549 RepID=A0A4C1ZKS3_EUMVA|nr:hypothetical protein EVAR_64923_1 [Eumeta japonica]